jgi:hypothetical protein
MQKRIVSTGALILGFAFASVPALAQNVQGPGAPDFGLLRRLRACRNCPSL